MATSTGQSLIQDPENEHALIIKKIQTLDLIECIVVHE
jgi:hypothetical protein